MKILVAKFVLEASAHVPMKYDMENVALSYGKGALSHMQFGNVSDTEDIDLIPVICADAGCNRVIKTSCFMYIEQRTLQAVKEHVRGLNGICPRLHGASFVEDIGSEEHHLLRCIRRITGPYLLIAISCDPHGNLTKEYAGNATILHSFREAPYTDTPETIQFVCRALVQEIRNRMNIHPVYRKFPLILGGERSVSADEPVRSINQFMNRLEKDERILSCSWHVGCLRYDVPEAGCGIVVVSSAQDFQQYVGETTDQLTNYVWGEHREFHYTGLTREPQETLRAALDFPEEPVFLTDPGDNVTSGTMEANTFMLRQVSVCEHLTKHFLFTVTNDPATRQLPEAYDVQEQVHLRLGMDMDECTAAMKLDVTILAEGRQEETHIYGGKGDYGGLVSMSVKGGPITIVVTDNNHSFVEKHQMGACDIDQDDYDVIVVKQGYIYPELKKKGKLYIVSPADGVTSQDTERIPFKLIMRPIRPPDDTQRTLNRNDKLEIRYEKGRNV